MSHILLNKDIICSDLFRDTKIFHVYLHLALTSSPNKDDELVVSVSLRKLADELHLSYQNVRTAINRLVSESYISKINDDKCSSVFIVRGFVKNGK